MLRAAETTTTHSAASITNVDTTTIDGEYVQSSHINLGGINLCEKESYEMNLGEPE